MGPREGTDTKVSSAVVLFLPDSRLSTRALFSVPTSVMGQKREARISSGTTPGLVATVKINQTA